MTKQENFDSVRQFCLCEKQAANVYGGTGGSEPKSGGGGTSETEEPPPIWIDDQTSSAKSQYNPY